MAGPAPAPLRFLLSFPLTLFMMNPAEFANIAKSEHEFWWYRGMRGILFGLMDPFLTGRRVGRALEAGCGTGYFADVCQRRYGWQMYPLDLGWEGLQYARQMGLERLAQADLRALPYPARAFDVVMSLDVIVHLQKGEEYGALRELARVLAPGGLLVLRTSALDILRSRHTEFAGERQRFTRARLVAAVERHGIEVRRCTYANSLLMPVALARFRIWEPLLGRPAASGVEPVAQWLDRLLYAPLALEARWLRWGFGLPLGQSLILIGEKTAE
jgi:SAM-dependent methyltransferase